MKEFFEKNTSEKILEASEEVMDMMEDCMTFGVKSKMSKNDTRQLSLK